jgi:hypothetical protein
MVAAGGAGGGVFCGLLTPLLLAGPWEFHLALVFGACLAAAVAFLPREVGGVPVQGRKWVAWLLPMALLLMVNDVRQTVDGSVALSRNFFGTLRIQKETLGSGPTAVHSYALMHGQTQHGFQFDRTPAHFKPTSYFSESSGLGLAILNHPKRTSGQSLRIGAVGMGIGTIAAYGRRGDTLRFYEINPAVIAYARDLRYFGYVSQSEAVVETVCGDARLSLEREVRAQGSRPFDVLVLDAFSGDAIPTHLLTREAFDLYGRVLDAEGILAWHITNWYVDFIPLAVAVARERDWSMSVILSRGDGKISSSCLWVLFSPSRSVLASPAIVAHELPDVMSRPPVPIWTDDRNSVWGLVLSQNLLVKALE